MNVTLSSLDEYFMEHYADYVRLAALEGYVMPETIVVGADGTVSKRDPACMRLALQPKKEELLSRLKAEQTDTDFTFSFRFLTAGEKLKRPFEKYSFARVLPGALGRVRLSREEAGKRLSVEPRFWKKIAKGSLIPEKNTVLALILTCGLNAREAENLCNACGYSFDDKSVRDVVVRFLIEQRVLSPELREMCLAEYAVTSLPIAKGW